MYDVRYPCDPTHASVAYPERSGGVNVNSPFVELYDRAAVPAAAVVTLDCGGTTGLLRIRETPLVAFQSALTCAAGMVGLLVRLL